MQDKLQKKLVLPVIALAIVGVTGATYTMFHSGPVSASAQTVTAQSKVVQDKETQDDSANSVLGQKVQQNGDTKVDLPEKNDTPDVSSQSGNGQKGEIQDGN